MEGTVISTCMAVVACLYFNCGNIPHHLSAFFNANVTLFVDSSCDLHILPS